MIIYVPNISVTSEWAKKEHIETFARDVTHPNPKSKGKYRVFQPLFQVWNHVNFSTTIVFKFSNHYFPTTMLHISFGCEKVWNILEPNLTPFLPNLMNWWSDHGCWLRFTPPVPYQILFSCRNMHASSQNQNESGHLEEHLAGFCNKSAYNTNEPQLCVSSWYVQFIEMLQQSGQKSCKDALMEFSARS